MKNLNTLVLMLLFTLTSCAVADEDRKTSDQKVNERKETGSAANPTLFSAPRLSDEDRIVANAIDEHLEDIASFTIYSSEFTAPGVAENSFIDERSFLFLSSDRSVIKKFNITIDYRVQDGKNVDLKLNRVSSWTYKTKAGDYAPTGVQGWIHYTASAADVSSWSETYNKAKNSYTVKKGVSLVPAYLSLLEETNKEETKLRLKTQLTLTPVATKNDFDKVFGETFTKK